MGMLMSTNSVFDRQIIAIDVELGSEEGLPETAGEDNVCDLPGICYRTLYISLIEGVGDALLEHPQNLYYPRYRNLLKHFSSWDHTKGGRYSEKLIKSGIISENQPKGDRDFFRSLPSRSVMTEVGIDEGGTARNYILPIVDPARLYLIDPWDLSEDIVALWPQSKENREKVTKMFSGDKRVKIVQDYSTSAAEKFKDHYFDCVYSDWALDYSDAKKEFVYWLPKVKKGGYIAGDTFNLESHHWSGAFGAILEFLLKYVVVRPDLLGKEEERKIVFIENFKKQMMLDGFRSDEYSIHTKNHPFSDVVVQISNEQQIVYQIKPGIETLEAIAGSKWFKYFPSPRDRGGSYRIEVGDWAENLDIEEIKKDMTIDIERQDGYAYVSQ